MTVQDDAKIFHFKTWNYWGVFKQEGQRIKFKVVLVYENKRDYCSFIGVQGQIKIFLPAVYKVE